MRGTTDAKGPMTASELGIMKGFPPPPEMRPTLKNWDLPPFNRWSFQNMQSLFPTVRVGKGQGPERELAQNLQDLTQVSFDSFNGKTVTISDWIRDSYTDGLLAMHRGRIVMEHYQNDFGPGAPHLGQSISKSLIGSLAGILHAEGLFDLHAPLVDLVPELADCGYADCTMDQALDMVSGVRFSEDYGVPWSDMSRVDVAAGWRPVRAGEIKPTIRDVILTLPKEAPHGQSFQYRSIETDVVAWALERAGKQDLAGMLSGRIWQKLGCEQDGFFTVDSAGTALADGGFNAAMRDYARFGDMMLNGGRVDATQVVPEDWVNGIIRGGDPDKFGSPYTNLSPIGAYRRFWWAHDAEKEIFMARGVFGQLIYIDKLSEFMVVKMSSWPDYLIDLFSQDAVRACRAIRAELSDSTGAV